MWKCNFQVLFFYFSVRICDKWPQSDVPGSKRASLGVYCMDKYNNEAITVRALHPLLSMMTYIKQIEAQCCTQGHFSRTHNNSLSSLNQTWPLFWSTLLHLHSHYNIDLILMRTGQINIFWKWKLHSVNNVEVSITAFPQMVTLGWLQNFP